MGICHRVGLITVLIILAAMVLFRLDHSKQVSGQQLSVITYDLCSSEAWLKFPEEKP